MSRPEFHRKTIYIEDADYELQQLELADEIDPDQKYHIGKAEVEGIVNDKMTLKFKYGGLAIQKNLHKERPEKILSVG